MIPFPLQAGQLGRARSNRGGVVGGFNYAAFLSGKVGDAWLANATHYTDTARTTVANVNDAIGSLSGEGAQFNAQQATAGARPTLKESSSKRYLDFDGTDVVVAGAAGNWNFLHNGTGNGYACVAIQYGASSDPNAIHTAFSTSNNSGSLTGCCLGFDDRASASRNNRVRLSITKGTGAPTADAIELLSADNQATPQTDLILEFTKTGTSVAIFVNGVSVGSGTLTSPNAGNSQTGLCIGIANGNFPLTGRIYGLLVCNTVPGTTDRAAIRADMSSRCLSPPI